MIRKSVAELLDQHVTFEPEAIDRVYLNGYVPSLQTGAGFVHFLKAQLGVRVPSTVMIAPMSRRFVDAAERFAETEGVDLVTFQKGQRKDDVAQAYLAGFQGDEGGALYRQGSREKASVCRTEKRRCLISALAFHEITSQIPHEVYLALKRGAEPPLVPASTSKRADVTKVSPQPVERLRCPTRSLDSKEDVLLSQVFHAASFTSSRKFASAPSSRSKAWRPRGARVERT